ncbi:MAG: toxin-antitoxin system, toxin component [bacterium]|nr:toxin-antitoxin system, toxin component [bacterium]
MPLRILVDESVDSRITRKLNTPDFDIIYVSEYSKGIPDDEVLELSRKFSSILLTEDRDFGEWVFAHHEENVSVVYLRYKVQEIEKITKSLITVLSEKKENLYNKFCVITTTKVRIRDISLLEK